MANVVTAEAVSDKATSEEMARSKAAKVSTKDVADVDEETAWQESFAASHEMLIAMAEKAKQDYEAGLTWPLEPAPVKP